MDLRQLRAFITVAECKSISLAAKKIHIAQPALTRQMQALEQTLETALFERTARGITLTNAGQQLLQNAYQLLSDAENTRAQVQRAGRGEVGHLSLAIPVMRYPALPVARLLSRYRQATPHVSLDIKQLLSESQLHLLQENRLDIGIALFREKIDPALKGIPLYSEKMFFAYPSHWQWSNGAPTRLTDLNGLDFIWISRNAAPIWHDTCIHCFFKAGFIPRPRITCADASSMLTMVAAGLGCTVVPEWQAQERQESVRFIALEDLDIVQHWEIVWRADKETALIRHFLDLARS